MLDKEQIKALIVHRLANWKPNCPEHNICIQQQIRALLAVLNDGKTSLPTNVRDMLRLADIPFTMDAKHNAIIGDEWLAAHGFHDTTTGDHAMFIGF